MLDLRHPGTIADIGYDNGYLLAELDELGHTDLVGVEKNPTLASKVMYTSRHKWRSRPRWITGNGLSCFRPGQVCLKSQISNRKVTLDNLFLIFWIYGFMDLFVYIYSFFFMPL
jgi:hypothetical protein